MAIDSRLKFEASQAPSKLHTWSHVFYAQLPRLSEKKEGRACNFAFFITSINLLFISLRGKKLILEIIWP